MDASATVDIERSSADVWAFVMDVENDALWRTGIVESGLISPPPLDKGTQGYARAEAGEVRWLVRELDPGRSVDWDLITGPIRGTGGYRVESTGRGTRFTLVADVRPTGWMRVLGPIFGWIGRRQNGSDVQRLKGILEGTRRTPAPSADSE